MLISGALIGASSVFAYNRYRVRRLHKRRPKGDILYEEYETQLTAAEKQVLHKISSADGALSLTLKLPDTALGMSLTPATAAASVCGSEKSLMSRSNVSLVSSAKPGLLYADSEPQSQETGNKGAKTPSIASDCKSENPSCPSDKAPSPMVARQPSTAMHPAADSSLRGLGLGFGVRITDEVVSVSEGVCAGPSAADAGGHAGTDARAGDLGNGRSATVKAVAGPQSTPATIKPHIRKPAAMIISAVTWSSPVDDHVHKRSISKPRPKNSSIDEINSGNSSDGSSNSSNSMSGKCLRAPVNKLLSDYPLPSANSSTLEAISSINTPISPRTLASPCGSTDYVFIPPSPSISSLYEISIQEGTLSPHQGSLLVNARSAGVAKSVSSPGSLPSVQSLFSPPPVHYHHRYFESHRTQQLPSQPRIKKSLDNLVSK
ncbi:hypothetical protein H4R99_000272 [Coemansia sp. RSA 1722]|nr:hypothetical protein LPJ57_004214 [Coemansia sp. RSA 486]KAJ2238350.1 hypothetical protein IWW45_000180 [Coemansia sp. RSA 485]KAJ2598969.1 hypothetical protein GGF39_002424 [Coemansia sp. RSA 1721]KAJ2606638.1 hypothetical protein H4R99_000272 [Coemansia sp. RSA 1722]